MKSKNNPTPEKEKGILVIHMKIPYGDTQCGIDIDNVISTNDPNSVTCKRCLRCMYG